MLIFFMIVVVKVCDVVYGFFVLCLLGSIVNLSIMGK